MNNRTFTKFTKHLNNSGEKVSAEDINKVQESINKTENEAANIKNLNFKNKVMFEFNNNLFVNALRLDFYEDLENVDTFNSLNIEHNSKERFIRTKDKTMQGVMISGKIASSLGEGIPINDFFLFTDIYIPEGAGVQHFLVKDDLGDFPIKSNTIETPLNIIHGTKSVKIKTILIPNNKGESPKIFGMSLMFFDIGIENQYGLLNPDIARFESEAFGTTVLIRDRALGDKLVEVKEPGVNTHLNYKLDGRLGSVETFHQKENIKVQDTLNYGDYLNGSGNTEELLLSISTEQFKNVAIEEEVRKYENRGIGKGKI